jgi:hypothetical protein
MSLAPGRDVVGRQDRFREGHLRHDDLTDLRRASDESPDMPGRFKPALPPNAVEANTTPIF